MVFGGFKTLVIIQFLFICLYESLKSDPEFVEKFRFESGKVWLRNGVKTLVFFRVIESNFLLRETSSSATFWDFSVL